MNNNPFHRIPKLFKRKRIESTVELGETFDATVKDINVSGEGVVTHSSGKTFFISGVWSNERIRVEVIEEQGSYGYARLVEVLEAHPARRAAPCVYHGACGGCAWMFVGEEAQIQQKQHIVQHTLNTLEIKNILPIWSSEKTLGYRTRAQLKSDGAFLGMVSSSASAGSSSSHRLIDIEDCVALTDINRNTLKALRKTLPNPRWRQKARRTKKHNNKPWVTLNIDEQHRENEVQVNERLPFSQANANQNEKMRLWLKEQLSSQSAVCPSLDAPVLELFCGSGNFTEILSNFGYTDIVAVEAAEPAVGELKLRGLPGVDARCLDLYQAHSFEALKDVLSNTRILVMDPPRDGVRYLKTLLSSMQNLRQVYYISCDINTFCRDAKVMQAAGFICQQVQPVDLFPQTAHVELLACFQK